MSVDELPHTNGATANSEKFRQSVGSLNQTLAKANEGGIKTMRQLNAGIEQRVKAIERAEKRHNIIEGLSLAVAILALIVAIVSLFF